MEQSVRNTNKRTPTTVRKCPPVQETLKFLVQSTMNSLGRNDEKNWQESVPDDRKSVSQFLPLRNAKLLWLLYSKRYHGTIIRREDSHTAELRRGYTSFWTDQQ
ncbi:uncharacterized protein LOC126278133 [Schistocerca gregaria]|uniref:uncharacterized protein LOC126278133 n=1 Tax=Schistocerca gregaria TaxID=7010 RepID=UPI00211F3B6C|nr:uncharacterized protein LOC126278133 [Schistocerca gregaria]